MSEARIGVVLDSFRQPVKEALRSASSLDLREIELPMTSKELEPAQLSRTGRRDLAHHVSSQGLHLSALGGDLGGARFTDSSAVEQRLEKTRRIMETAAELRVPVVTTHLGVVTSDSLKSGYLREALRHLAEVSDRTGTRLAIDTGSGDPQAIADLLREIGSVGLGACYDPASLIIEGFDPLSAVSPMADRIFVAHVRDATAGSERRPGHETPLGEGQVDLAEYLAALDQAGYRGVQLIRRTGAMDPLKEIAADKSRLERFIR
jgi:L-ribulose-5-phosphate 3-epimerase